MKKTLNVLIVIVALLLLCGCAKKATSVSGATLVSAGKINLGPDGLSVEQANITRKIQGDNEPGATRHLYVISPISGLVIIYSTIDVKATSSGKHLMPPDLHLVERVSTDHMVFDIDGKTYVTRYLPDEDGTYGSSLPYLYWWDTKGVYHEHYLQGGQILHISDEPLAVKNIVINMELPVTEQS